MNSREPLGELDPGGVERLRTGRGEVGKQKWQVGQVYATAVVEVGRGIVADLAGTSAEARQDSRQIGQINRAVVVGIPDQDAAPHADAQIVDRPGFVVCALPTRTGREQSEREL